MLARYYQANLGRFMAVDPALDIEKNLVIPQHWNRYAYALNNPIKYADQDGQDEKLMTWAPSGNQVGHSAIAVTQRQANGAATGKVVVREKWPANEPSKLSGGKAPAEYRTTVINEADVGKFRSGEGRAPDSVVTIRGDAAQDAKVTGALDKQEANPTYDAQKSNCADFTKAGVAATGISGGTGGSVSYGPLSANVTTPVSVNNAVTGSGDSRVTVDKPLPKEKQSPDIK